MNDILWYEITNLQGFICCKWFWNLLPCKYNMVCMCHFVLFLRKMDFGGLFSVCASIGPTFLSEPSANMFPAQPGWLVNEYDAGSSSLNGGEGFWVVHILRPLRGNTQSSPWPGLYRGVSWGWDWVSQRKIQTQCPHWEGSDMGVNSPFLHTQ